MVGSRTAVLFPLPSIFSALLEDTTLSFWQTRGTAILSPLSSICAAPRGLYLEYLGAGLNQRSVISSTCSKSLKFADVIRQYPTKKITSSVSNRQEMTSSDSIRHLCQVWSIKWVTGNSITHFLCKYIENNTQTCTLLSDSEDEGFVEL